MEQTLPRPIRIPVRRGSAPASRPLALDTAELVREPRPRPEAANPDLTHRGWMLVQSRAGVRLYRRSATRAASHREPTGQNIAA